MTPSQFFSKNLKWIALILLVLFLFKGFQSCNRNSALGIQKVTYEIKIDSLINVTHSLQDSIKQLQFDLKIAEKMKESANERANAVQSTAEKIKANTTITVKGVDKN